MRRATRYYLGNCGRLESGHGGFPGRRLGWTLAGILPAALAVVLAGPPGLASASAGREVADSTASTALYTLGTDGQATFPGRAGPDATLDAPDCKDGVSDMHVVERYKFKKKKNSFGTALLRCGLSKWGYRHIAASDNGKRITNFPGGWAGFNYAITGVEKAWTSRKYRPSNETYAYSKIFYLCNHTENWYRSIDFIVVNQIAPNIITAVPDYGKKKSGSCPVPSTAGR